MICGHALLLSARFFVLCFVASTSVVFAHSRRFIVVDRAIIDAPGPAPLNRTPDPAPSRPAAQETPPVRAPVQGSRSPSERVGTIGQSLLIPRVKVPPTLDSMNPADDNEAAVVVGFRQKEPDDGLPASATTVAYVSYDDEHLYVMFECHDDGWHSRAHLARREDISDDDQVFLYLDTFRDRRRAYVFAVNPLGVQRDGIVTEGQGTDYSFDAVWRSEGRRTEGGFTVLMAIPFKSLRFSTAAVQTWGIALGRYTPGRNEYSYWPYVTGRVDGFVNQMAEADGIQDVSPGRNIQFVPYGVATSSRFLDTTIPAFARLEEWRGGLDSKIVIKDAFTLDVTLRPDFSQVESDEPQVTVNQRFEVFFPERRPFFIENAGFFVTPENLFFSRRVEDPEVGVRLTGKVGRWAIGAVAAADRAPGNQHTGDPTLPGIVPSRWWAVYSGSSGTNRFLAFLARPASSARRSTEPSQWTVARR